MKKETDPRMHSAEHILNRTMIRMFDCGRALNAHIEKKKSKCDYRLDRPLSDEEVHDIQRRVNDVIRADLPIAESFITREEAQARFDLGKLPEDADDTIRIVSVGDYDDCPCLGRHVPSSGQIGSFRITTSSFENGVLRIRFKLVAPFAETQ